jgi:hypothetical protein
MTATASPDRRDDAAAVPALGRRHHLVRLRGRLRKWLLRRLEYLAYDVVGLPMACSGLLRRRAAGGGDAAFLHHAYARVYWRLPAGLCRGAAGLVLWPFVQLVMTVAFTRRNGAAVRRSTGKSAGRQMREQLGLATRHSIAPFWYYMFELHDDRQRALAPLFLTAHETIAGAYAVLQPPPGSDRLNDKVWFARHCRERGLAAVPVLLLLSGGRILPTLGETVALPDADLFVKPRVGNGGRNTERWDWRGDGRYHSSRGLHLTPGALLRHLALQSLRGDFVVQPRLANHPDLADLANDALSTVRVLTCRNEQGAFEATNVAFRMAIGGNNLVDNFHSGGIATPVDLATGEIGAATDMGLRPEVGWRETHPVSGARIAGRRLPFWRQVVELACRTHEAFPERTMVGWDVAMLPHGAIVIEGNGKPDLDIHQRVERRPLGDQRIARLLAYNLQRES